MKRFFLCTLLTAMTALGTEGTSLRVDSDHATSVTFNKDVLPLLQENCQSCHRQGGIAPMALSSYEGTRPWAKAIKAALLNKKMPPWFADSRAGEFRNAPKLSQKEIDTLVAWVDNGAVEGDAADKPAERQWVEGWRIQPDVIVAMPQPYKVSAKGNGEVREFIVPNPFTEDTWVSAIEIRPGEPSVVHHVIVQIPEKTTVVKSIPNAVAVLRDGSVTMDQTSISTLGGTFVKSNGNDFTSLTTFSTSSTSSYSDMLSRLEEKRTGEGAFMTMEAVYAPGSSPLDFRYSDAAKLIRGGKPIRIEVHYTPNGKETLDQTRIAFTVAKEPAHRQFVIMAPEHMADPRRAIPQGEENYETVGELTFKQDADLVWFMPHMHLRGKDMTYKLVTPDGHEKSVLSVKYNFNWQLGYELETPIKVTKGTRLIVTAHHDNSANNPMNPTPNQAVSWGEMTSQEMMLPWFGVVADINATPQTIATYQPPDLDSIRIAK